MTSARPACCLLVDRQTPDKGLLRLQRPPAARRGRVSAAARCAPEVKNLKKMRPVSTRTISLVVKHQYRTYLWREFGSNQLESYLKPTG